MAPIRMLCLLLLIHDTHSGAGACTKAPVHLLSRFWSISYQSTSSFVFNLLMLTTVAISRVPSIRYPFASRSGLFVEILGHSHPQINNPRLQTSHNIATRLVTCRSTIDAKSAGCNSRLFSQRTGDCSLKARSAASLDTKSAAASLSSAGH